MRRDAESATVRTLLTFMYRVRGSEVWRQVLPWTPSSTRRHRATDPSAVTIIDIESYALDAPRATSSTSSRTGLHRGHDAVAAIIAWGKNLVRACYKPLNPLDLTVVVPSGTRYAPRVDKIKAQAHQSASRQSTRIQFSNTSNLVVDRKRNKEQENRALFHSRTI